MRFAAALERILAGPRPKIRPLGEGWYHVIVEIPAPQSVTVDQLTALQRVTDPKWPWTGHEPAKDLLVLAYEVPGRPF